MSDLTCPKCKGKIASESFMYCYHCGEKLFVGEKEMLEPTPPKISLLSGKKWLLAGGIASLLVAVLFIGLVILKTPSTKRQTPSKIAGESSVSATSIPEEKGLLIRNIYFPMIESEFKTKDLASKVPVDVEFYWESSQPEKLAVERWDDSFWQEFNEKTGLKMEEALSFLESNYVLFGKSDAWALLAKINGLDFLVEKLKSLPENLYEGINVEVTDGYLIISNSEELIDQTKKVFSLEISSLGQKTEFAQKVIGLPLEGQALVWLSNSNSGLLKRFLPEKYGAFLDSLSSFGKEAFVIKRVKEGTKIF